MAAAAAEVERTGYGKMPLLPSEVTTGMTASLSGGTESKLSKHYRGERHPFGQPRGHPEGRTQNNTWMDGTHDSSFRSSQASWMFL